MYESHQLSVIAKLIGDPSRAIMLSLLIDGRARTASELSVVADITSQTASAHLAKLLQGNLVSVEQQGRHRYYRLANNNVGDMLESMLVFSHSVVDKKPFGPKDQSLHFARSCYDHLAGELSVQIFDGLKNAGVIVQVADSFVIKEDQAGAFKMLDIDINQVKTRKRPLIRTCLDWSERHHHLAGALGAAVLKGLLDKQWVKREENSRLLALTKKGNLGLKAWLPDAF